MCPLVPTAVAWVTVEELDAHLDARRRDRSVGAEHHGRRQQVGDADHPRQGDGVGRLERSDPAGDVGLVVGAEDGQSGGEADVELFEVVAGFTAGEPLDAGGWRRQRGRWGGEVVERRGHRGLVPTDRGGGEHRPLVLRDDGTEEGARIVLPW